MLGLHSKRIRKTDSLHVGGEGNTPTHHNGAQRCEIVRHDTDVYVNCDECIALQH